MTKIYRKGEGKRESHSRSKRQGDAGGVGLPVSHVGEGHGKEQVNRRTGHTEGRTRFWLLGLTLY